MFISLFSFYYAIKVKHVVRSFCSSKLSCVVGILVLFKSKRKLGNKNNLATNTTKSKMENSKMNDDEGRERMI